MRSILPSALLLGSLAACQRSATRTPSVETATPPDAAAPASVAGVPARDVPPAARYTEVARALEAFIAHEMRDKQLPALSIALVDGQEVVWARGFGWADSAAGVPASAATTYRVGSVSKLFTDLAVMQLVERGALDLDAPVTRWLPDFTPQDPFGTPITLRQLMSHRAGVVREPPAGHYFDTSGTSLAATVRSLNGTRLVYAPTTRTKYSNAGIATVGYVLERTQGEPFASYVRRAVLRPMGMAHSAFAPDPAVRAGLAKAVMWTVEGRTFPAPTFELGMAPAGSMYAPVTDLAQFLRVLFAGGAGAGGQVIRRETLEQMWRPQFAPDTATRGYGIGFAVGRIDGRRTVSHGGAIYGFATEL
ncbi:MAG TPA: serine hydrolase domain-containing protein, partial [Gemmatimonadales bacterium]|nr:serine hydrolase domain-containing protein [Gemmatimonadales bacterium]